MAEYPNIYKSLDQRVQEAHYSMWSPIFPTHEHMVIAQPLNPRLHQHCPITVPTVSNHNSNINTTSNSYDEVSKKPEAGNVMVVAVNS